MWKKLTITEYSLSEIKEYVEAKASSGGGGFCPWDFGCAQDGCFGDYGW